MQMMVVGVEVLDESKRGGEYRCNGLSLDERFELLERGVLEREEGGIAERLVRLDDHDKSVERLYGNAIAVNLHALGSRFSALLVYEGDGD